MIIEQVRIVNCNRFTLGGRKDITLKPKSRIQMILGTNGSGKSSFMELCFSPLSPSPNDFDQGGYWEFKCSDKGSDYFLSADYDKKKYTFIKDKGENLNPGGTITVQDALVEQYFGYTRYIHNLLIMNNRLTQMTPRERGDVISKISREDLTFAYNKFREWTREYNSSRSIQKFLLGRIGEEETKLMPEEDIKQIKTNITNLKKELRDLMDLDRPEYDSSVSMEMVNGLKDRFFEQSDRFLRMEPPVTDSTDVEGMRSKFDQLTGILQVMSEEIRSLAQQADTMQSKKKELERLSGTNVDEVESEIEKLENFMSELPPKTVDVPDELLVSNDVLVASLIQHLSCLSDSPEEFETKYRNVMDQSNKLNEALNKSTYALSNIESKIQDMVNVKDIICPNCTHTFKPGVDKEELSNLQERALRGRQYVFELNKKNGTIIDQITLLDTHKSALEAIYAIRDQNYQSNRGLFMYIDSLGGFHKGKTLISYLSIYSREALNKVRRQRIVERLDVLKTVLSEHSTKNVELVELKRDYERLENLYNTQLSKSMVVNTKLNVEASRISHMESYTQSYNSVLSIYESLVNCIRNILVKEYVISVDIEISKRQSSLALNENSLSNNDLVETLIKDLKNQLDKANLNVDSYKAMVDAINPKNGLIAERMHAQIGSKVDGINKIISKIWNYDFVVKMPDVESGNLDYRFPIVAEGQERADIRLGSGSMRDIVDTAFAILVHHSLELTGYPIYLDEFDSPFDGVHTNNMVHMVKDLADTGRYSHVVVISHDENIQNAFPDAEILVLDDRNLDSSTKTNTHVEFR